MIPMITISPILGPQKIPKYKIKKHERGYFSAHHCSCRKIPKKQFTTVIISMIIFSPPSIPRHILHTLKATQYHGTIA